MQIWGDFGGGFGGFGRKIGGFWRFWEGKKGGFGGNDIQQCK